MSRVLANPAIVERVDANATLKDTALKSSNYPGCVIFVSYNCSMVNPKIHKIHQ